MDNMYFKSILLCIGSNIYHKTGESSPSPQPCPEPFFSLLSSELSPMLLQPQGLRFESDPQESKLSGRSIDHFVPRKIYEDKDCFILTMKGAFVFVLAPLLELARFLFLPLRSFWHLLEVYGFAEGVLLFCFSSRSIWRLEAQVLGSLGDDDAFMFKKSVQDECTTISIAVSPQRPHSPIYL